MLFRSSPEKREDIKPAFGITEGNPTYELTDAQMQTFYAVVAAEAAANYDDALGVASVALNIVETEKKGKDLFADVIANKNVFEAYGGSNYNTYMTNPYSIPEYIINAVDDAIKGGVRNTACNTFKSNENISFSNNMITKGGNRYAVYSSNRELYKL